MIVSVEQSKNGVTIFSREEDKVSRENILYQPWILFPSSEKNHPLLKLDYQELDGSDGYNRIIRFDNWEKFQGANDSIRGYDKFCYWSRPKNYLVMQDTRLFKDAEFDDVYRMVIDIECQGLNSEIHRVLVIACVDNRGQEIVFTGNERQLLSEFINHVKVFDPDTIEGHNLIAFDLPFILRRCELCGIECSIGRNGSIPWIGRDRKMMIGPQERSIRPIGIYGRHVLDTFIAVQRHDVGLGRLNSFGLKEVSRTYGIDEPNRVELDRSQIQEYLDEDPALLNVYALQDIRETEKLSRIVHPVEFFQTQLVPDNYGSVAMTGNGEKLNSIFISEYLKRGKAIPFRQQIDTFRGAQVECRKVGLFGPIVKCDVESLYPALMLTKNIKPKSDTEDIVLPMLADLKSKRLNAKRKMQEAKKSGDKKAEDYWDGFQTSSKYFINSFYGYLGGPFPFADRDAALQVTTEGRKIVQKVADEVEAEGGEVIEVDTDGVLFVPPLNITEEDEFSLIKKISGRLPSGIVLAHDGRYEQLLSLKMKNYVLKEYSGRKIYKGASLKNRASEPIYKKFLIEAIDYIFNGTPDQILPRYNQVQCDFLEHKISAGDLQRRERITNKTKISPAKKRLRAITDDLSVGDYVYVYDKQDGSLALIDDYEGDENTFYYMQKLYKIVERLEDVIDLRQFPKPGKRNFESFNHPTLNFE